MAKTVADIFETLEWGPAPESRKEADAWLDAHERRFGLFIDGAWHNPEGGEYFDTHAPANGSVLAQIGQATPGDVGRAVAAARAAQSGWEAIGGHGRARYLYAIARGLQKHSRIFSVLETLDNGKPIRESRDIDIPLVARHFYHHAGWAQLFETEMRDYSPVGVVGQIIPWNFPLLMLAWKIAPALAMGNTVVLKPAEFTSLTALRFAELCASVGLPKGVVNIITGDGRTGAALVEHPDVDKIAFTGSTDVGRIIRVATAGSGKKLSLELGGKSPFIVFDDADIDSVVEGVVDAIWFNQGQVCCAGSRMLMHEGIAEQMVTKLRARMEKLRVGDPLDKAVDIGAIIAPVQLERITALVKQGVDEGATMWQPSWSCPTDGWFYPPTLFTDVSPSATIMQEEIFGPVLVSSTFRTPEEAVELANNTRYGLAASIWTENINLALDIAPKVLAGTVWINCTNVFDAAAGFGGYRESGYGREGGREGLFEYVKPGWMKRGKTIGITNTITIRSGAESSPGADIVAAAASASSTVAGGFPTIDRTAKLYIGGKQARPDGGYSYEIAGAGGGVIGEASLGNRKDIRNAVEAANKAAPGWARATGHLRAQILYYLGENLAARADELAHRLERMTGDGGGAAREVDATVRRLFTYAAWADKYDGAVHHTPFRNVTLAMPEPIGAMGVVAPDSPALLGFVSLFAPVIARGNTVVAVPSQRFALAATDFYQVLDTSDVPAGVVNIVTGTRSELTAVLAAHDDIAGIWYFAGDEGSADVERLSAGNMKRTWVDHGHARDWCDVQQGEGAEFLRESTQVKNIWVPYGE